MVFGKKTVGDAVDGDDVPLKKMIEIEGYVVDATTGELISVPEGLDEYKIPSIVKLISRNVFANAYDTAEKIDLSATKITSLGGPEILGKIFVSDFCCLKEIVLPDTLTRIDRNAIDYNIHIRGPVKINIPPNLQEVCSLDMFGDMGYLEFGTSLKKAASSFFVESLSVSSKTVDDIEKNLELDNFLNLRKLTLKGEKFTTVCMRNVDALREVDVLSDLERLVITYPLSNGKGFPDDDIIYRNVDGFEYYNAFIVIHKLINGSDIVFYVPRINGGIVVQFGTDSIIFSSANDLASQGKVCVPLDKIVSKGSYYIDICATSYRKVTEEEEYYPSEYYRIYNRLLEKIEKYNLADPRVIHKIFSVTVGMLTNEDGDEEGVDYSDFEDKDFEKVAIDKFDSFRYFLKYIINSPAGEMRAEELLFYLDNAKTFYYMRKAAFYNRHFQWGELKFGIEKIIYRFFDTFYDYESGWDSRIRGEVKSYEVYKDIERAIFGVVSLEYIPKYVLEFAIKAICYYIQNNLNSSGSIDLNKKNLLFFLQNIDIYDKAYAPFQRESNNEKKFFNSFFKEFSLDYDEVAGRLIEKYYVNGRWSSNITGKIKTYSVYQEIAKTIFGVVSLEHIPEYVPEYVLEYFIKAICHYIQMHLDSSEYYCKKDINKRYLLDYLSTLDKNVDWYVLFYWKSDNVKKSFNSFFKKISLDYDEVVGRLIEKYYVNGRWSSKITGKIKGYSVYQEIAKTIFGDLYSDDIKPRDVARFIRKLCSYLPFCENELADELKDCLEQISLWSPGYKLRELLNSESASLFIGACPSGASWYDLDCDGIYSRLKDKYYVNGRWSSKITGKIKGYSVYQELVKTIFGEQYSDDISPSLVEFVINQFMIMYVPFNYVVRSLMAHLREFNIYDKKYRLKEKGLFECKEKDSDKLSSGFIEMQHNFELVDILHNIKKFVDINTSNVFIERRLNSIENLGLEELYHTLVESLLGRQAVSKFVEPNTLLNNVVLVARKHVDSVLKKNGVIDNSDKKYGELNIPNGHAPLLPIDPIEYYDAQVWLSFCEYALKKYDFSKNKGLNVGIDEESMPDVANTKDDSPIKVFVGKIKGKSSRAFLKAHKKRFLYAGLGFVVGSVAKIVLPPFVYSALYYLNFIYIMGRFSDFAGRVMGINHFKARRKVCFDGLTKDNWLVKLYINSEVDEQCKKLRTKIGAFLNGASAAVYFNAGSLIMNLLANADNIATSFDLLIQKVQEFDLELLVKAVLEKGKEIIDREWRGR